MNPVAAPPIGSLACSFCGKAQADTKTLWRAGAEDSTLCICDECVFTCLAGMRETDRSWFDNELRSYLYGYQIIPPSN